MTSTKPKQKLAYLTQ